MVALLSLATQAVPAPARTQPPAEVYCSLKALPDRMAVDGATWKLGQAPRKVRRVVAGRRSAMTFYANARAVFNSRRAMAVACPQSAGAGRF